MQLICFDIIIIGAYVEFYGWCLWQGLPEILQGVDMSLHMKRYRPPLDEFEVDHCDLPTAASVVVPFAKGPSIYVVMNGKGTISTSSQKVEIQEGDVLFTYANTEITLETTESCLDIYRAGISSHFFSDKICL